jgi:hypothetical protein
MMQYEVNVTTGEIIEREPTAEELEQEAADHANASAYKAEQDAKDAATAAAKSSARAKLAAIGLTEEEIAAITGAA